MQKFTGYKVNQITHPVTEVDGKRYKVCCKCLQDKPVELYSKKYEGGYFSRCKECIKLDRLRYKHELQ